MSFRTLKLIFLGGLLICYQAVQAEVIDRVVAKVNDNIITLSEVLERAQLFKIQAQQLNLDKKFSENDFQRRALDSILEEKLLLHEGKNLQMEVDEGKVKLAIEDIKKENNVDDEVMEQMLRRDGFTMEQYKNKIRDQIMISQVRRYQMRGRVKVSERKLLRYYKNHIEEFIELPKIHVRHILFSLKENLSSSQKNKKREQAEKIFNKLKRGADFNAMAKLYSEDESASVGGDLGVLERGKMVKEFEEVAFQLLPGEISPVVETSFGLHIIKVNKVIPPKTRPFQNVKAHIEKFVFAQEGAKTYENWIKSLKKKSFIEDSLFTKNDKNRSTIEKTANSPKNPNQMKQDANYQFEDFSKTKSSSISKKNQSSSGNNWNIENMEKRLRYIKILQKRQIINDQEYQKRKEEILDQY